MDDDSGVPKAPGHGLPQVEMTIWMNQLQVGMRKQRQMACRKKTTMLQVFVRQVNTNYTRVAWANLGFVQTCGLLAYKATELHIYTE